MTAVESENNSVEIEEQRLVEPSTETTDRNFDLKLRRNSAERKKRMAHYEANRKNSVKNQNFD